LFPKNEKQVRALGRLARPEDRRQAWEEAVKQAHGGGIAAGVVTKIVEKKLLAGAAARAPRQPKRKSPLAKMMIGSEELSEIRQHLRAIYNVSQGANSNANIAKAIGRIEQLLKIASE
jgi:hypothetical protein